MVLLPYKMTVDLYWTSGIQNLTEKKLQGHITVRNIHPNLLGPKYQLGDLNSKGYLNMPHWIVLVIKVMTIWNGYSRISHNISDFYNLHINLF